VIAAGREGADLRTLAGELGALLEREKRRGREFLRWGPAGRRALALLDGKADPGLIREQLLEQIRQCRRCRLGGERKQAVPGEGPSPADMMIVGEGPGPEEDQSGRPFVGPAGDLLTRMLQAIARPREKVFITHVVKCRPPGNRDPEADEVQACFPFLQEQIRIVNPRLLVALGGFAARTLTGSDRRISELRGRSFSCAGRLVIPTYHPAYLLDSPEYKRPVWEDLKKIRRELDRLGAGEDQDPGSRKKDKGRSS
jgi:uracil-DNA glycosylase family 4